MNIQVILLLIIVFAALVVFIGGWLRVDLVGLLILAVLAVSGLVSPQAALAGFSSPAVVTTWAMFILSAGLTRTGVAHHIGRPLMYFAKSGEVLLTAALMIAAALLSALINTVTVAVILLPVTMELARRSGRPPSRLLMPMALGSLLGGPFTAISTSNNILAVDIMRTAGFAPFALLDFTPITGVLCAGGILFVALAGRYLLPRRAAVDPGAAPKAIGSSYQLATYIFTTRIPAGSRLAGHTLAESRIGSALFLTVVGLQRHNNLLLAPRPTEILQAGDTLIVHGRPDHLQRWHGSHHLRLEAARSLEILVQNRLTVARAEVPPNSPLVGATMGESGLRRNFRLHVLTLLDTPPAANEDLRRHKIRAGQQLLLQGERAALDEAVRQGVLTALTVVTRRQAQELSNGHAHTFAVRVPDGSVLVDQDLVEGRLGDALGLTVAAIARGDDLIVLPPPNEKVLAGDLLIVQGFVADLEVLEGLQDLEIVEQSADLAGELESQQIGVTEVLLSPRTNLAGRTLADLRFRDHYGLSVLAVWRKGRAFRSGLQDMPLQFGDALLAYGRRSDLAAVARDPDFVVLDHAALQAPRLERASIAGAIMIAVLLSAILGLMPIAIAALSGAALMVLCGCLSMDEAYRAIEWKVVFLIASMLPLGAAIQTSGAAGMAAAGLIEAVGHLGPRWVVAVIFVVTVAGSQVIPTAALVVLMAPVALSAAAALGISPHLLMMAVAISASASYTSPLSHPAHLLVMGPGGYRYLDYVKVGVPLTVVVMAMAVWLLPILWPPF